MIKATDRIAIIAGERQITFREMLQYVSVFAAKTPIGHAAKTLIVSENREGWIYALYAIWNNRGVVVPVDAASTPHDIAYIIADCTPEAVWTSREKLPLVEAAMKEAGRTLMVLLIDDAEQAGIDGLPAADINYEPADTALICYTSGTTGSPKGVMLSFENIMANVHSVWTDVHIFDEDTRTIVLLPLHHVLPLVGTAVIPFVVGCGVAICPSLSGLDIMDTLQRGQIGIMIGVPRLWQTLFRGIKAKVDASSITRALYNICDRLQCRALSRLVFTSVRKKMGGRIRYCVAGGAALDAETARGLKTLGLDVLEGYGMTETAPIIAFTRPGDIRPGCVGLAMPAVEVKIVDGELCARGRNVMLGYYNRPEETAAIIDADGFVHTGDMATIDATGHITITGRKKEIIVLSNGKNVNPSEIEEKLERYADIVKEVAVTEADDLLVAIVVPQEAWAQGKTAAEMEDAVKREVLQPYNEGVAPYKKVMSVVVFQGELPRTRLEKLQRFKLRELLVALRAGKSEDSSLATGGNAVKTVVTEPDAEEYRIIRDYIATEKHLVPRATDNLETDLAFDSLDIVSLQGFIEQSFGMRIASSQILAQGSVELLAAYVAKEKTIMRTENVDWHKLLTLPTEGLRIPKMATTGVVFTRLCRWFYRLMFRSEAYGLDNIPAHGPYILAPNHQSFLDAPLVVAHLDAKTLRQTYFYAKRDHVHGPVGRMLAQNHNVIVMDMSTLKDSIRALGQVLAEGKNLVIFPEGTRTLTGKVGSFKKTFAILAKELGVPVVPVRIDGAYEAWPRTRLLPRPHKVTVTYLPPIVPMETEDYDGLAQRVRNAIL